MTKEISMLASTRRTFVKGCFATAAAAAVSPRPLWATVDDTDAPVGLIEKVRE